MEIDRRTFLAAAGAMAMSPITGTATPSYLSGSGEFPKGFLWGAATAGHQVEGNNIASDIWLLESVTPTVFAEPSGDADNSLMMWPTDLDLVRDLGLNTYRFSLEWARIEPEPGMFSIAMLDYYKAIIAGCRARGLAPVVSFNHFTTPRWFAAAGGWTNSQSPNLFARYCERATRHLGEHIAYAATFNEPNALQLMQGLFPPAFIEKQRKMLDAAAHAAGSEKFAAFISFNPEDTGVMTANLIKAHQAGRAAIKVARGDLPVGLTLALPDDEPVGPDSIRDQRRSELYGTWLELAKDDDFVGVQNYDRTLWDAKGMVAPPPGGNRNFMGREVYAPSLAGAVRYAYEVTRVPVIVTEHGVGTDDDTIRAELIPAALAELHKAMHAGVVVKGYIHWSLLDNYEWVFGFKPHFGLCSVDRKTFKRTPKPSATVLGGIAKRNSL
jgi:beta-glucosidase